MRLLTSHRVFRHHACHVSDSTLVPHSPFEARLLKIFIGRDGLRPVWRLALYLIAFQGAPLLPGRFHRLRLARSRRCCGYRLVVELGLAVIVLVPALPWRASKTGHSAAMACRWVTPSARLFWIGICGDLFAHIAVPGVARSSRFYFGGSRPARRAALKFAVFWAAFFLIVGFYEEFFTRGYTQFTLTEGVGFWPAAILLSLGFGALHLENPGENWVGILAAMLIGFFFCLTLRRTGNLVCDWFSRLMGLGRELLLIGPGQRRMPPGHLLHLASRARAG